MAEFTSAEKVNIGYENEYSTDAMTGGPDKRRQLYYQLIQSMKKAESVDIIVSFLMESGVRMLLKELEHTLKRGAKIRILTGNYLGITQPSALYLIKRKLGDRVDLRFYCEKGRSFHPAADRRCSSRRSGWGKRSQKGRACGRFRRPSRDRPSFS